MILHSTGAGDERRRVPSGFRCVCRKPEDLSIADMRVDETPAAAIVAPGRMKNLLIVHSLALPLFITGCIVLGITFAPDLCGRANGLYRAQALLLFCSAARGFPLSDRRSKVLHQARRKT